MAYVVKLTDMLTALSGVDLLPAIIFRSSRSACDLDVDMAMRSEKNYLPFEWQKCIEEQCEEIARKYDMDFSLISAHPQYRSLIRLGIGAHHAGQLLIWRLLLEELMAASLLRVLVATGTVAAGVDFPARTVVVTADSRRGANGFSAFTSSEFQQMSGRAGRRGKDTVGFCIIAPSQACDARKILKTAKRCAEPLRSAYFPSPSTVLNLLRYRSADELEWTVQKSLAAFDDQKDAKQLIKEAEAAAETLPEFAKTKLFVGLDIQTGEKNPEETIVLTKKQRKIFKRARRLIRQAKELQQKQVVLLESSLNGLNALGYLDEDRLSDKGKWAANLCTSLVLELAEIIEAGFLDGISMQTLVSIIAALSADSHRSYIKTKKCFLSDDLISSIAAVLKKIQSHKMPGVLSDRSLVTDASHTVLLWLHSESWQEFRGLLRLAGTAEGDAARLITQTAEHLNQLNRLSDSHPEIASLAMEARMILLRPPLTEVMNFE